MTELKNCPFCDGPAKIENVDHGPNKGGSYVYCTQCLASSNLEFGFKANFVSNWNRRVDKSKELERLIDAIQYVLLNRNGNQTRLEYALDDLSDDLRAYLKTVRPI